MNISTINLKSLPNIEKLKRISQSIAMLDVIIYQEWEYRYYSFNSKWSANEMMASMRNGQGSHYFLLFFNEGAAIKGFDIDAPVIDVTNKGFWKAISHQIPNQFAPFLNQPAFVTSEATFFIWRSSDDLQWKTLDLDSKIQEQVAQFYDFDGSRRLLSILDGIPQKYKTWADSYYESDLNLAIIEKIYNHDQLTKEMVENLNPDIDYEMLIEDIDEIGYPCNINIT